LTGKLLQLAVHLHFDQPSLGLGRLLGVRKDLVQQLPHNRDQ